MRRFYLNVAANKEEIIDIPQETGHHIFKVLRLKREDEVIFFNGQGEEYLAKLLTADNEYKALIVDKYKAENKPKIKFILAQALIKNEKLDFILQKSTELGVDTIIPYTSERSLPSLPKEKVEKKLSRWQKIVVEASQQCERNNIPLVTKVQKWEDVINISLPNTLRLIASTHNSPAHLKKVLHSFSSYDTIILLIGPEGGFTEKEVAAAVKKDFIPVSLGENILRTETAALAALAMLAYHFYIGGENG